MPKFYYDAKKELDSLPKDFTRKLDKPCDEYYAKGDIM
jgi:hypothetical protein